jgi:hypothetical protein
MRTHHCSRHIVLLMAGIAIWCSGSTAMQAASPDFVTAVGSVEKLEKDTLRINAGDKTKKTVELKVTGTSNFFLLSPQVRAGKTIVTQRSVQASDLAAGQAIAVIYTVAGKENVLLTAVIRPLEKK